MIAVVTAPTSRTLRARQVMCMAASSAAGVDSRAGAQCVETCDIRSYTKRCTPRLQMLRLIGMGGCLALFPWFKEAKVALYQLTVGPGLEVLHDGLKSSVLPDAIAT